MDLKSLLGDIYSEDIEKKIGDHRVFVFGKDEEIKLDGREYVPKTRFNEVNEQAKEAKSQLDQVTAKFKALEKDAAEGKELKQKLAELNTANESLKSESDKRIAEFRKREAVKRQLLKAGAKDEDLLIGRLELDKISLEGENILGFDDQLKQLKETHEWAFSKETVAGVQPTKPPVGPAGVKNPFHKDSYNLTEQMRIMRENPQLAEQLKSQA